MPDAGQASRELQGVPEFVSPQAQEILPVETASVPAGKSDDKTLISVTGIRITGSSEFTPNTLEELVSYLIGGQHSLSNLEAGAARITAYYRAHGFLVARAYLPVQDIKDGVVTIAVLEGHVGAQRINNQSRISDARANGYLSGIGNGNVLLAKSADRALLLLNDTPGVGSAKASIQPGASIGTSDLIVELTPSAPYVANVDLDNYGNRYTGERRLGAMLVLNSPFRMGDEISLSALTTDQHLNYAKASYELPVGNGGLRLGAAYSNTRYRLGKEFSGLKADGSASNAGLHAIYPFIRSQASNLSGVIQWERKKLRDSTNVPATRSEKQVQLINLGVVANHQDAWGGAGITSFELSWVSGRLNMDAISRVIDESSAKSNGLFTRLGYNVKRLQRLTATNTLLVVLSGQQAGRNLHTSEKLYLGGAQTVRAYPQGEASGDEGYLANLEFRHDYASNIQVSLFYDGGAVKINHKSYITGTANTRYIAGAGVGMSALLSGIQIRASLAWRTSGGDPTSESSRRNPRLWLLMRKQF